jgi:predicted unusual protein kinase regulating ubiquinone biosynthesis (AarF/ABC1/UbiB family)
MEVASTITNVDKIVISMKNHHNHLLVVCHYLLKIYEKNLLPKELSKELPSWLNARIRSGRTIAQIM